MTRPPIGLRTWNFLKQSKYFILFITLIVLIQGVRFSFTPPGADLPIRIIALGILLFGFCYSFSRLLITYQEENPKPLLLVIAAIIPIFLLALYSLEDFSNNFSFRFWQISVFVCLFSALYLFLRKNLLNLINENLTRFNWNELTAYHQTSNVGGPQVTHCELTTGTIFQPAKNQIITKNCLVDSGSAVFALLKQPFRWSRSYVTVGDSIPAGSYLVAGKIDLAVENLKDEPHLSFLKEYLANDKNLLAGKIYYLFIGFYLLASYLILSITGFSLVNFVINNTILLAFAYFLDLAVIVKRSFPALKERLASRAIFCNDFLILGKKSVNWDNISPDFQLKKVSSLMILSDLISEERVALLIFYLTSYSNEADFQAIHEEMQSNYLQKYLTNPLEKVQIYQNGFLGELEGIALCFGSEQFLLENGIVLNTSEVMGRARSKHAYYLALNREVYAGVEVSDRLFSELQGEASPLRFSQPLVVTQESILPLVDRSQLGKNLQIVGSSANIQNEKSTVDPEAINIFFEQTFDQMISEQRKYLLVFNLVSTSLLELPFKKALEYSLLPKFLMGALMVSLIVLLTLFTYPFIALQLISLIIFIFILILRKRLSTLLEF